MTWQPYLHCLDFLDLYINQVLQVKINSLWSCMFYYIYFPCIIFIRKLWNNSWYPNCSSPLQVSNVFHVNRFISNSYLLLQTVKKCPQISLYFISFTLFIYLKIYQKLLSYVLSALTISDCEFVIYHQIHE